MDEAELCYVSALELREQFQARDLSPVEVADAVLRRIERLNPTINAFVTVTSDLALDQARVAEQAYASGDSVPELAGIPTSLKDLTPTKGIRTTRGSLLYKDWVPDFDAPFAERLYTAGVVMLGKTNTPEMGYKGETSNRVAGTTHCPWEHGRTPGGSSGGASAAVAAGMGPLAQGSDGGGSIRIPASFAGIFGFKQSWGLVPQFPPSAAQFLSHNGPMTRTVRDAALMLNVMAGADERDQFSWSSGIDYLAALDDIDITGKKIAYSPNLGYIDVDQEVADRVAQAVNRFEDLGCDVEQVDPNVPDPTEFFRVMWLTIMAGAFAGTFDEVRDQLDPGFAKIIEEGNRFSAAQAVQTNVLRNDYYTAMRLFMTDYDLLLTPTTPTPAPPVGGYEFEGRSLGHQFTCPFNLTSQPAASAPCGFTSDGLPVGLQIIGRWRDDVTVLRAAAAFEAVSPWADARPPVD